MAEASALFVIAALKRNSVVTNDAGNYWETRRYSACGRAVRIHMSRVLFVTDDGDLRAVGARVLARAGWEVTTASHGGHALLACIDGPPFDVVVLADGDAGDGDALAERLRRYCPELRVVSMSRRPFTADDLIDRVLREACALATA